MTVLRPQVVLCPCACAPPPGVSSAPCVRAPPPGWYSTQGSVLPAHTCAPPRGLCSPLAPVLHRSPRVLGSRPWPGPPTGLIQLATNSPPALKSEPEQAFRGVFVLSDREVARCPGRWGPQGWGTRGEISPAGTPGPVVEKAQALGDGRHSLFSEDPSFPGAGFLRLPPFLPSKCIL